MTIHRVQTKLDFCKYIAPLLGEIYRLGDPKESMYDLLCACGMLEAEEDFLDSIRGKPKPKHVSQFLYHQANTDQVFFVFTDEKDESLGLVGLEVTLLEKYKHIGAISWMVVDASKRSQGIGSKMLSYIEKEIIKLYPSVTILAVESDKYVYVPEIRDWDIDPDQRTVKFYEKNGYKNLGLVKDVKKSKEIELAFWENGEDVILVKEIN